MNMCYGFTVICEKAYTVLTQSFTTGSNELNPESFLLYVNILRSREKIFWCILYHQQLSISR